MRKTHTSKNLCTIPISKQSSKEVKIIPYIEHLNVEMNPYFLTLDVIVKKCISSSYERIEYVIIQ